MSTSLAISRLEKPSESSLLLSSNLFCDNASRAAYQGSAECLALLLPVSDPLATNNGTTALVWATIVGSAHCVSLLLPVSDLAATDNTGRTASELTHSGGLNEMARLIDSYQFAQFEKHAIHTSALESDPPPARTRSRAL